MSTEGGKTIKQRLILWSNRLRFDINIQRKGWFAQFVLHEGFKPFVRGVKIVLTLIGLISAFISFQSVFVSFLFGVVIYLLSTAFEKLVFSYNSLYVHSLPDFEIEPEKWLGAFFGYAEDPRNPGHIPMVGWIMSDAEYAKKVHSLLRRWSYGKQKDEENNIRASVIVDNNNEYILFCYSNMERETATRFYEEVEKERKKTSLTDIHHKQMAMLIFDKRCQITENSYFPTFRRRYVEGVPYLFRLVVPGGDGQPREIAGLDDFIFFNLKIKDRRELDRKDIEYDLLQILG